MVGHKSEKHNKDEVNEQTEKNEVNKKDNKEEYAMEKSPDLHSGSKATTETGRFKKYCGRTNVNPPNGDINIEDTYKEGDPEQVPILSTNSKQRPSKGGQDNVRTMDCHVDSNKEYSPNKMLHNIVSHQVDTYEQEQGRDEKERKITDDNEVNQQTKDSLMKEADLSPQVPH
ncbi:hypothetical protein HAX54_011409 [Datura stramonium]|uniref:Uncharacterized protein n=1 Tax=Datura stramonium TaxID=4076 RepID=A0ABS8TJR8_DATST|nr:hypothetical protein [Datura stramonium]